MNTDKMKSILADLTMVEELKKCSSVRELETCLNNAGAECTREEALRFLRTCNQLADEADEREASVMNETQRFPERSTGIIGTIKSFFRRGAERGKIPAKHAVKRINADDILYRMSRQHH